MFTLSSARSAIGNAAQFARGGAYVKEGCVSGVTVRQEKGLLIYEGRVRAPLREHRVMFEYDEATEAFVSCICDCGETLKGGCRHAAALMIAVCGGAGEPVGAREGGDFIGELLDDRRMRRTSFSRVQDEDPVHLYVQLRKEASDCLALSLKIGRTRPYVVRSMAELAQRANRRESAVYGRELTFSHSEEELDAKDAALFGQIVMLCGEEDAARGSELMLRGAALDQMMRLMKGRAVEIRDANGGVRRAEVIAGDIALQLELTDTDGEAEMLVEADEIVTGSAGAYLLGETQVRCAFGGAYERIAGLLQIAKVYPQGVRFGEKQLDEVCTRLILPAKESAVMRKGQAILASHTPTPMTPRMYVDMQGSSRLVCRVVFDYCGVELGSSGEAAHIRRDTALEEDVRAQVARLFPLHDSEDVYAFEGDDDARFELLGERLASLERTGEVMISKKLTQTHVKRPRTVTFALAQKEEDKLTLKADLGGFTQEELTAALGAYRLRRAYVRLDSGVFLSGEALEQAAQTAQVLEGLDMNAQQAEAGQTVPMSRAMYLEAALENRDAIELDAPDAVTQWVQRLRQAQSTKAEQPSGLKAQLRSYQLEGLCWLLALSEAGFGGILADDMGLGKTIQALSMLLAAQEKGETVRAMVVCPASLQLNWLAEAQRFAPSLTAAALTGSAAERAKLIAAEQAPNLLITSYDQLRRDVQLYENIHFTHVLLDEAQHIKNAASQAARAVKTLWADHRFAMTGTPIENRLSELWSVFDFLMPGYLGSYKNFRDRFEAPVVREADDQARENLHLLAAPFILRRMKKDVLSDLPEKVETVMSSEMTAEQKKLYYAYASQLRSQSESAMGGQEKILMLAGLTRLRQLCCDPRLCMENYKGGSGKLTQLMELVREAVAGGHKILLFSQFTSMLDLIAEALGAEGVEYFLLTGETDKEKRMEMVTQFNAGGADVFLISLKAGGTGLNLTGADVVIHYDPWWNVAAQNQATDRAYRIGQTKGVQVIKLIASDTVEEHILKIQERKSALSDGVLLGEENLFTIDAQLLREVLGG